MTKYLILILFLFGCDSGEAWKVENYKRAKALVKIDPSIEPMVKYYLSTGDKIIDIWELSRLENSVLGLKDSD